MRQVAEIGGLTADGFQPSATLAGLKHELRSQQRSRVGMTGRN